MKKVYTLGGTPTKRNLTMHCMQAHKASNTKMVRVAGECYRAKGLKHQMCQLFLDIYKAIGLKDASSHSGRRTYITRLANKGVGVRLLAALAGHSHISTTQRYIDVNSDQLSEAVELL